MTYTSICDKITEDRMADDHCQAEKARAEYGDKFNLVFRYRRGSEWIVMTTDASVAKHYHTLKNQNS